VATAVAVAAYMDLHSPTAGEAQAAYLEGHLGSGKVIPQPITVERYQITYRITAPDTPTATEVRSVLRPFDGRDLTFGPHGNLTNGVLTNAQGAYAFLSSPRPHWGELEAGTYRATGDERPAPALGLAVAHGMARVLGTRTILGRPCTEVRTGGPAGQALTAPTVSTYADLCLDRQTGQILDELWVLDSKLVRHRTAVSFSTSPHFGAGFFNVSSSGPIIPDGQDGSESTLTLSATQAARLPLSLVPPPGYHIDGIQAQVTQQANPQTNQLEPSILTVTHYVSGSNLVDLEEGDLPPPPSGTINLRLADGRQARLTIDITASYLDVTLPDGYMARLEGPDLALLERMAGQIQVHPTNTGG
jgi:hypothetical protein